MPGFPPVATCGCFTGSCYTIYYLCHQGVTKLIKASLHCPRLATGPVFVSSGLAGRVREDRKALSHFQNKHLLRISKVQRFLFSLHSSFASTSVCSVLCTRALIVLTHCRGWLGAVPFSQGHAWLEEKALVERSSDVSQRICGEFYKPKEAANPRGSR